MDLLAPKNIIIFVFMSNKKTSTSEIASTYFYSDLPKFYAASIEIYLLGPSLL